MPPPSKGYPRGFIVLLLTVILGLAGCDSGTTNSDDKISSDATTGSITGIVVASSSISFKASRIAFQETLTGTAGVSGAVCTIEGTGKNTSTDEHGFFTITDIAPASYILICRKTASDGKIFAYLENVVVKTGETTDIGTIQVTQTGAIQGKATLADQTHHEGISVYIPGLSMQAATDATGTYLINDVPEGTYNLFSEKDGYAAASLNITVTSGATAVAGDIIMSADPAVQTTYDPVVNPNISVTIVQPTQGATADTPLLISVTVKSLYELKDVKARVHGLGAETNLAFSGNAVCTKWDCGPGWGGSISLTGSERGERLLIVKASDIFGNITEAARSFIFDQKPVLSVTDPLDETVARPLLHISALCTDDGPAGCTSITVKADGTVVASGQSSIDEDVSLASFDGRQVTLRFEAKDSANQSTTVERVVYVEASSMLTEAETGSGAIFDVQPDRILFLDKSGADPVLKIRNRITNVETLIPAIPGKTPQYGFLTPRGAIFAAKDNDYRLFEWIGNEFATISFPTNNNLIRSTNSLKVSGNYAIWNLEKVLSLRSLLSGKDTIIYDNTEGWGLADVAANGDVVFGSSCGGFDCNIFRYRQGTTTRLTNDLGGPTIGYSFGNRAPLTDGINVIYSKKSPPSNEDLYAIAVYGTSGEEILSPARPQSPSPGSDYQLNNGWIAFTKTGSDNTLQIWVRSPSKQETKLTFWGTSSRIVALSPGGEVTFINGNRMYLSGPGLTAVEIGSSLGRSFWQNGEWFVTIGRSLFRVVL